MHENSYGCYDAPSSTLEYSALFSKILMNTDFNTLDKIADKLAAGKTRHTVFLAGNGGSASTASHFANDLSKGVRIRERCGFRCMSLCDPSAIVSCLANDFCYEDVYSIMLQTYAKPGDFLVVFSGSGNSENIIRALTTAKNMGVYTIGFGGRDGGRMKNLCDICLIAPTYSMEQLEDAHLIYIHSLVCRLKVLLMNVWDIEVFNYPKNITKIACDGAFSEILAPYATITDEIDENTAVISSNKFLLEESKKGGAYTVAVIKTEMIDEMKRIGIDCDIPSLDEPELLCDFIFRRN